MARLELKAGDRLVVKVGTASLVGPTGEPDEDRLRRLCQEIAELRQTGVQVILVSSGAIAAGLGPLGLDSRPGDIPSLQAAAAVGQGRLLSHYSRLFEEAGLVVAQMLLTRYDFMNRQHYVNARNTLDRLLALGVVPIVNENDTVAVDEIRFGDNDRLAALVGNLARARLLALLTDAKGLHTDDPRRVPDAPILDEVVRITPELERRAGGRGSSLGTGGMASKIAAAWVATFSGVGVVVADASESRVLTRAVRGERVGTFFHPRAKRASARRLWIAFAQPPRGTVVVDAGARRAMVKDKRSLLPVGVVDISGSFESGEVVDVSDATGELFARGLIRYGSTELREAQGRRSAELAGREVIHRDQLIILEGDPA
ncbi:MAG: glutamate 5-kinase [Actinomycetota bacterium]|nr:glutamate 5-kinase [Actinomycetota bacterium]